MQIPVHPGHHDPMAKSHHLPCRPSSHQSKGYSAFESNFTYLTCGLQEVTTYRARFPKAVHLYLALLVFGPNIVASEGEEWKRYRTISAPAFSEVCTEPLKSPFSFSQRNPREMPGWYGMKHSASCSICSTMSGATVPKSWWITV